MKTKCDGCGSEPYFFDYYNDEVICPFCKKVIKTKSEDFNKFLDGLL